jgi:hypothetical protein
LEGSVDTSGQPVDRRIQIAVDFGVAAADGRWGAYWVGFVSDKVYSYPEYPDMQFPGHKIEWLSEGAGDNTIGGDPIDGYAPLGYLFPAGYIPDSPVVVHTGLGVHLFSGFPLGCSTDLIARREQFTYDLGIDTNINHLPDGFLAWDEEGADSWVLRLRGRQVSVFRNQFANMNIEAVGLQTTVQQGALVPSVGVTLEGQAVTVLRSTMLPERDIFIPLVGKQLSVLQGVMKDSIVAKLTGQQLTVQRGALAAETSIVLKGQQVTIRRGPFLGMNVDLPLTGLEVAVRQGALGKGVGVTLTGQAAHTQAGAVQQGRAVALVGQKASIKGGALGPGRMIALTGHSLSISQGSLHVATAARLTGLQSVVVQGAMGQKRDVTLQLRGLAVRILAGELPIQPVPPENQLMAKQESIELFINEEPPE